MSNQKPLSKIIELDLSEDVEIHKNYILKENGRIFYVTNVKCVQVKGGKLKVEVNYKEDQLSKWRKLIKEM